MIVLHAATIGKIADMLERRFLRAEEIAVERQDRLGLVEFVVRLDP